MNWYDITNQTIANIVSAIAVGVFGIFFIDNKRILKPWVYKIFGKRAASYLDSLINFFVHPFLRVILTGALLIFLYFQPENFYISLVIFIIVLTFYFKPKKQKEFLPLAKFQDRFDSLDPENWFTKNGDPSIETDFGKPAPDLGLKYLPGQATNSFVFNRKITADRGIVECDFYLEEGSIFNIVFFGDINSAACVDGKDNWYMARFDSRNNFSDGFLIKEQGPGVNWKDFKMSGTQTKVKEWHRARIEFGSTKVSLYKNGVLLVEFNNPKILGNRIGFFNELAHVHVDNFSFIENVG